MGGRVTKKMSGIGGRAGGHSLQTLHTSDICSDRKWCATGMHASTRGVFKQSDGGQCGKPRNWFRNCIWNLNGTTNFSDELHRV